MELKRVMGRLAPRWPVLLIAGLIGAIAAFIFVQQRNSEVEPVYSATATVDIPVAEEGGDGRGGSGSDLSEELAAALDLAKTVNEPELRMKEIRFVEADSENNALTFGAIEETEEAAIVAATSMRSAYVAADPSFDVNAELKAKLDEASLIAGRLDELIPEDVPPVIPTPEEAAAAETQLTLLQSRESALVNEISELNTTKLDTTDDEEIANIDEEIAGLEAELLALRVVLIPLEEAAEAAAAVAAEPEAADTTGQETYPDLPIEDQWTIQALSERLTTLQTESAELIVASVTGAEISLPEPEVVDESPSVTPTWLGLLVGFIAGAVLWAAVILGFDRMRGIVWQGGDIKAIPVLAEGPAVAMSYADLTDLERHRRKRSVQAIRSAIIGAGRLGEGTIVGFASPPSTEPYVRDELAHDVAASVAAVGRSVLVVDLGFEASSMIGPQRDRSGLRELFDSVGSDEAVIREKAAGAIASAERRGQGLDVLTADSDVIDPADILAGRPLTELLNQARDRYDIVLIIQPTTTVNSGAGVDAYLQQQVIVCTRGKTRVSEVNSLAIKRDAGHVQLVGAAILVPESSVDRSRRPVAMTDEGELVEGQRRQTSKIRRIGGERTNEASLDRIRSLENYSVEESAMLQSSEQSERT